MNKTVVQMFEEIQAKQDELNRLKSKMHSVPFWQEIIHVAQTFPQFEREATVLAKLLTDRDEPMSRDDIRAVFVASGFEFTEADVDAADPDSEETINEQIAYYRRHL